MDFFQVISPSTLAPRGAFLVLMEIVVVIVIGILVGAGLSLIPPFLVTQSKKTTHRTKTKRAAAASAPTPASQPRGSVSATQPASTSSAPATATAPSGPKESVMLDDILDSFFAEESVLDEALVDTVVATAHGEKPTAATADADTKALKSKPAATAKPTKADIDGDLAAKMMRGIGSKSRSAAAPAAAQGKTVPSKPAAAAPAKAAPTEDDLLNQALGDLGTTSAARAAAPKTRAVPKQTEDPEDNLFDVAMREATKPTTKLCALEEIDEL